MPCRGAETVRCAVLAVRPTALTLERTTSGTWAVIGAKLLFSAITIAAYGFHRDELYLQECGRHLAWGFVDHGPLVPALSFLARHGLGPSPAAARVFCAAASLAAIWATARVALELGGDGLAQLLAAALVAIAPLFVYSGGVFGTNAFDQLAWTLAGLFVLRGQFVGFGICVGLGLMAKPTMALGALCLLSLARARLRGAWVALPIAAAIAAPFVYWEYAHGWPGIAFIAASRTAAQARSGPLLVFADQIRLLGPISCVAAVVGMRRRTGLPFLLALILVAALGGKAYYATSAAPLAVAAGSVALVDYVRAWPRLSTAAVSIAALIQGTGTLPLLPRLPLAEALHPELVQFADWQALASRISTLHAAAGLDPSAPVLTDSYGTASALAQHGGPPVLSGANSYATWAWEGRDEPDAVLAIGYSPELLRRFFGRVEPAGRIEGRDNRFDFPRETWKCTGRIASLRAGWASFVRYD
jgi:Dolichyl-phosphate-mannose-protein mannosyltransferase